jgi:hypothetical protein
MVAGSRVEEDLGVLGADPVGVATSYGGESAAASSLEDGLGGDAEARCDVTGSEPVVLLVGWGAGWPRARHAAGGFLEPELAQAEDVVKVQGAVPSAFGDEVALGNELGHVAHVAAEELGGLCYVTRSVTRLVYPWPGVTKIARPRARRSRSARGHWS